MWTETRNDEIRAAVVQTLCTCVDLATLRYKLLKEVEDCQPLTNGEFHALPHFSAPGSLLMIQDRHAYVVPKKGLRPNVRDICVRQLSPAFRTSVGFHICEGRLVAPNLFYASQVHMLDGRPLTQTLEERLSLLDQRMAVLGKDMSGLEVRASPMVPCGRTMELVTQIPHMQFPVTGLIFMPFVSGCQYVFVDPEAFRQFKMEVTAPVIIESVTDGSARRLVLRKTDTIDVYEVLDPARNDAQLGIACVDTLQLSHRLRTLTKAEPRTQPMDCVYAAKWNKWKPKLAL